MQRKRSRNSAVRNDDGPDAGSAAGAYCNRAMIVASIIGVREGPREKVTREEFMQSVICTIATAALVFSAMNSLDAAQQGSSTQQATAADPASNPDQEFGKRFLFKAKNLPAPKSDPVAASRSLVIQYAGQTPRVMEGFTATPFVTGLEHPRRLLVLPNNDVIVAEQRTGYLTLLRDQDGDGKADFIQRYADDFAL
jgi:glucose/arabinose dehydrogenase